MRSEVIWKKTPQLTQKSQILNATFAGSCELLITFHQIAKGQVSFVGIDGFPQALVAALLLGQEFQDSGSSQMGQWLVGIVGGERVKGSQGLGIVLWGGY